MEKAASVMTHRDERKTDTEELKAVKCYSWHTLLISYFAHMLLLSGSTGVPSRPFKKMSGCMVLPMSDLVLRVVVSDHVDFSKASSRIISCLPL